MAGEIMSARLSRIHCLITQTEGRIVDQVERIERLAANGCDTRNSRDLLCTLEDTLRALKQHREVIEGLVQLSQEMANQWSETRWFDLHTTR